MTLDGGLERLLVFAASASLAGLALGQAGHFSPVPVLAIAALATLVYHRAVPASPTSASTPRAWQLMLVLLLALVFRYPPDATVQGGQDQGVYMNVAAELLRSGDFAVHDAELPRISQAGAAARDAYLRDNYGDPFLPGVYTEEGTRKLSFQFYHLLPVWLALAGGLLGWASAGLGLTVLSLVSLVFFQRLAAEVSGRRELGLVAGVLLAINPLHAFFSRFPLTEVPTLAFACAGFFFLARFVAAAPGQRASQWLPLSVLALGCLFLTRISGFMYLPMAWGLGVALLLQDPDRSRARAVALWSLAVAVVYAGSIAYGLAWSRGYALDIYEASFVPLAGAQWPIWLAALVVMALAAMAVAWRGVDGAAFERLRRVPAVLARAMGPALLAVTALGLLRALRLGFTTAHLDDPRLKPFPGLAAAGWDSVAHSSLVVVALYASPVLLLAFLVLAQRRLPAVGQGLLLIVACFFAYAALLNWVVPYQPYYARYVASEVVPGLLLFAVVAWAWVGPRARRWLAACLGVAAAWSLVLSVAQWGKHEDAGALDSIGRVAALAGDEDLILLDHIGSAGFVPEKVKTTLVYTFGRHVVSIGDAALADPVYLRALDERYDRVLLVSPHRVAPAGFTPLATVPVRAIGFAPSTWPDFRQRPTLDAELKIARLDRAGIERGTVLAFDPGSDPRIASLVGRAQPGAGLAASGEPGYLMYGPYLALPAGHYRLRLEAEGSAGPEAWLDVAHGQGQKVLAARALADGPGKRIEPLDFEVPPGGVADLEVRVRVAAGSQLRLRRYSLTRLR